jgi:hypothetical protein
VGQTFKNFSGSACIKSKGMVTFMTKCLGDELKNIRKVLYGTAGKTTISVLYNAHKNRLITYHSHEI